MSTVVYYFATRDSVDAQTDEDRAMAHASYGQHASLEDAQDALVEAVTSEVDSLRRCESELLNERADEIESVIPDMVLMSPAEVSIWSYACVEAAGLVWKIIRSVHEA